MAIDPRLTELAIRELPETVAFLRSLFHRANPSDPIPTTEELVAALQQAIVSSLAKDAQWLAQHPAP